jgi:hypothetical protein
LNCGGLHAKVAHLVEHDLAKVGVAGSSPVFRSKIDPNPVFGFFFTGLSEAIRADTLVAELVDALDLKSSFPQRKYGFNSRLGY